MHYVKKLLLKNYYWTYAVYIILQVVIFYFIVQGFLLNWGVEKQIWDYVFGKDAMKVIQGISIMNYSCHDYLLQLYDTQLLYYHWETASLQA